MTTELSVPKGHGIVRVAHNLRHHVTRAQDWGQSAGTDYWGHFGDLTVIETGGTDLDQYGWLTNAFSHLAGSGASHLSSSDVGTTGGINFDTAGDYLISPFIFGDYAHALQAGQFLGRFPTRLYMEAYARFAANNDEEATGFGFVEAGTDDNAIAKGDWMAGITSDGTNFSLESGAAAAASDGLDSTTTHQWRIQMDVGAAIKWYIDGTQQTNTLALQTDLAPYAWAASTVGGGDNDPVIAWVHIWYE